MAQKLKFFSLQANRLSKPAIGAALYVALFVMVVLAITPERYGIEVGAPAPITIMATKDVVDTVTTEQLKEAAARAVEPSYKRAEKDVAAQVLSAMDQSFAQLAQIANTQPGATADGISDAALEEAKEQFAPVQIEKTQLAALMSADADTISALFQATRTLVNDALNSYISEGQESDTVSSIARELAKTYDTSLVALASNVVRAHIQANMIIDEETTEANRQAARDAVETVTRVKGEVIVRDGEIVTQAHYEMLKALGMVESEVVDMPLYYGVALFLLLVLASCIGLLYAFARNVLRDTKLLLMLAIVCVLTVLLSLLVRTITPYLMPVSTGVILVAILVNPSTAFIVNIMLSMVAALLASGSSGLFTAAMFSIMITPILSSPLVFIVFRKRQQRTTVLLTGLVIGVANMLIAIAMGFVNNTDLNGIFINSLWSAGSGLLSAMFCIGLQPLMEWMFNLVTSAKLLELSNPSQPLLRRLMLEAPGTYHHSMVVANLAEAAASAIGANGLLARVGAYYHDVGKLKRPLYFKENQMGDNPHDRTDPRVSASIVIAHTRDGVQIAQRERIPEPILDIIRSHHGDTAVVYFYDKAVKLYGDKLDPRDYRYSGPRPHSREAAIVMLADAVEAAERSMQNPNPAKMRDLLRKIIRGKMEDGQLDECELTFADLDKIREAFETVLAGVFHERIEYPTIEVPQLDREEHRSEETNDKA